MTDYTAEQMELIGGKRWQRGKHDRVYLNDWHDMVGLHLNHYKSGNICSASLNGEQISNRRAGILAGARVFWENGQIMTDLRELANSARVDGDALVNALLAGIEERVAEAEQTTT